MNKGAIIGVVAVAALGLAAMGASKANAQPAGGGGGPPNNVKKNLDGQPYFNNLSSAAQGTVVQNLYGWYAKNRGTGGWPAAVGDPGLSSASDLWDAGNFGITLDAFQTASNLASNSADPSQVAGVLDANTAAQLGAMT